MVYKHKNYRITDQSEDDVIDKNSVAHKKKLTRKLT